MGDRVYFAFTAPLVLAFASSNLIPRGPLQTFLLVAAAGTFVCSGFILYGSGILRTTVSQDDREYNLRFLVYWLLYFGFAVMALLFMVVYPLSHTGSTRDTFPKTMVTPLFSISWALYSYVAVFSAILSYHPMTELKRHLKYQRMLKDVRYDADKVSRNLARKDGGAQLERIRSHISRKSNRRDRSDSLSDGEASTQTSISTRSTVAQMSEAPVYKYTNKFNGFLQSDGFMSMGAEAGQPPLSWWYYVSLQFLCAFLASIALVCVDFFNFTHAEKFVIVLMYLVLYTTLIDLTIDVTGKWKFLALPSYSGFNGDDVSAVGADSYVKTTFTALLLYLLCMGLGVLAMVTNTKVAWLSGLFGLGAEALIILSLFMYRADGSAELDSAVPSAERQGSKDTIDKFGLRVWKRAFKVLTPEVANIWSIAVRTDAGTDQEEPESSGLDGLGISAITHASEKPSNVSRSRQLSPTVSPSKSKNLKQSLGQDDTSSSAKVEVSRGKSSSIWSASSSVAENGRNGQNEAFTDEEELCRESDYVVDQSELRPGAKYEDSDDESEKDPNYLGQSETEMGLGSDDSDRDITEEEDEEGEEDGELSEYYSDTGSLVSGFGGGYPMGPPMYPSELRHRRYSSELEGDAEAYGLHPYGFGYDEEGLHPYAYAGPRRDPLPRYRYSLDSDGSGLSIDSGHTSIDSMSFARESSRDRERRSMGGYEESAPGMKHEKRITRIRRNPYEPGVKNRTEVLRKSYTDLDPKDGKVTNTYHDTVTSVVTKRERNRRRKIVSKTKTIRKQKA